MCVQFGLGRRRGNVDRTSAANQRPTSGFYAGGRRVFALDVRASKKRRRRHFSICPAPFVAFGAGGSVAEFPLFVFWLFFFLSIPLWYQPNDSSRDGGRCFWMLRVLLRSAFHRAAEWAWLRCRPEFSIGRKKEAKGLKAPRGVVEVFQCETKEVVVVVTRSGRCRGRRHRLRRRARRD